MSEIIHVEWHEKYDPGTNEDFLIDESIDQSFIFGSPIRWRKVNLLTFKMYRLDITV